jgi:hypothetical protein
MIKKSLRVLLLSLFIYNIVCPPLQPENKIEASADPENDPVSCIYTFFET